MPHDCKRPIRARREVRMSLRKKPTRTEKSVAARHTNGRRSPGPNPETKLAEKTLVADRKGRSMTVRQQTDNAPGAGDGRVGV